MSKNDDLIYDRLAYQVGLREVEQLDAINHGAEMAALKLKQIADDGTRCGTFGGVSMEDAAKAIMRLHNTIAERNSAIHFVRMQLASATAEAEQLRSQLHGERQ